MCGYTLTLALSPKGNGIKLSRVTVVSNPSLERLGYPQMPLCGTSGLASRGDESSRGV